MTKKWQPRYVHYARERGLSPEQVLEQDRKDFPGGVMCEYMIWIQKRWHEWAVLTEHPRAKNSNSKFSNDDHTAFDSWLSERTPK